MFLYKKLVQKFLFCIDAEQAHHQAINFLKYSPILPVQNVQDPRLHVNLAGLKLPNPIGMAAGFDKDGEVFAPLFKLGFGSVEVGTTTPRPQAGNPKPRLFREPQFKAVVNRMGFNNQGHGAMEARIAGRDKTAGILGINIGANKDSEDFVADYILGIERFYDIADYITMNISSPNTPGLRNLQGAEALELLLSKCLAVKDQMAKKTGIEKPAFLKIAPDLNEEELSEIAGVIMASSLDGVIISNTTLSRQGIKGSKLADEAGGLSGKPLFERSTIVLAKMRQLLGDDFPIIGVGGITDVDSAWQKLEAGANALQVYSGMVFEGPNMAVELNKGIAKRLTQEQISSISALTNRNTEFWASRPL
jgi:dihydroorotate dehydrogenase